MAGPILLKSYGIHRTPFKRIHKQNRNLDLVSFQKNAHPITLVSA